MKPKEKILKNGLRIITIPMTDNPTVTVMVMVEAGSRFETRANNGISHFLEHMCFKGTEKRKSLDIAYELEAMGAETNAFTGSDYTGYYAKGQAHLFPKLLDVVADVYLHSTFPADELEKERGVISGEIDMYEDMPQRKVHDVMSEALYGDQPAGYTILGPKENIKTLSRDAIVAYRNSHYIAEKTTIVVAGNITASAVEKLVTQMFKNIRTGKKISKKKLAAQEGDRSKIVYKKTDQSHIVLGMRSIAAGHADATALGMAIGILGQGMSSRLFNKLREEMGAGYYVRAGISATDDGGDITLSTGTEPKRVPEVFKAMSHEVARMRTELVSEGELNKQKEYFVGGMLMGLETTDAVAGHYAHFAMIHQPLKTPQQIEKEIRAVTVSDIKRVAQKYLKETGFHVAVIGPHTDANLKLL
ncbi:MAG: pitrilysin family protein [bacterium]